MATGSDADFLTSNFYAAHNLVRSIVRQQGDLVNATVNVRTANVGLQAVLPSWAFPSWVEFLS